MSDLWWSWGYERNYTQNDIHTALQLHAHDDQGCLRYDIRGDVVSVRIKKCGVHVAGSLSSEPAHGEPVNDRVSTLHHRKLIAEFDEERLLAYEAFRQGLSATCDGQLPASL